MERPGKKRRLSESIFTESNGKNNDILKEVSKIFHNWEDGCSLLDIDKSQFKDGLSFFQSITWLFLKEIIRKIDPSVIHHIEKIFPHVVLNNVSFSNLPLQTLMKNKSCDDLDVGKEIAKRVSEWTAFARVLGFQDHQIRQMGRDYLTCFDRSHNIMMQFCHPLPVNNSWAFWKNYLLRFIEGGTVIYEIETDFPQLINECTDSICHCCIANKNGLYFHQHMSIEKDTLLPLDEKRYIDVNVGGDGLKMLHYQNYKQFEKSKQEYFDSFKILMDIQTFDFMRNKTNYCDILQTIQCFLNGTQDDGFAFKGYSLRNHYAMIGQSIIPKEQTNKHILAYFSKENILMHIKICDDKNEISKLLNNFAQEVRFAQSVHECICDNAIVHIGVVLIDDSLLHDQSIYPCNECVEKRLMLPKSCFSSINSFKEWYEKVVKQNKCFIQINEQIYENKEIKNCEISRELKQNIISQMAIKSHDFPTFTPIPPYQIQELDKVVLLSPCQMNVLYSPHKHIFIRGGYGSGKSLVLQKRFEKIIEESDENDIFYLICFDPMSKFADQMKLLKVKYPEKFICVFNIIEIVDDNSLKLSKILHLIKDSWKSRIVNVFIDEFNGALIDNGEVKALKEGLKFLSNSHNVIAAQSMEYELLDEKYKAKFQYDLLASETSFELYQLDYSLRFSVEITNFFNNSMDVLETDPVLCSEKINAMKNKHCHSVDAEFGMQFYENAIDETAKRKYTFNKATDVGHGVSCEKVELYISNYEACYQMNLILHHLLSGMEEKVVVCTFNSNIYDNVNKMLEDGETQWTANISDFIERKSKFKILLTDYASVRGFEFQNFIFMFDLSQEYMNYRLIEILTRATTNLNLIVNLVDNKQPKLVECWKTLECVEWRELSFNENMNQYVLKSNSGEEISLECSMLANVDYSNEKIINCYPWYEGTYQDNSYVENYDELILWIIIMKHDDIKLLNELLQIHAINIQQYNILLHDRNLLHLAAEFNAVESCKYLLEKYHRSHNDVNDIINSSPDDMNVTNCCHCKFLVNMKDKEYKCTPLHYAVDNNNDTMVNILLDHGAGVNITDEVGKTPLHNAVKKNNETIVNNLIDHDADVNMKEGQGKTPLHYAAGNNNETMVNILVDHGANVNIANKLGKTPFHYAARNNNETIVTILVDHGSDVNMKDESGKAFAFHYALPLHYSIESNIEAIVNVVCDDRADVNITTKRGKSPLHYAVEINNEAIVNILVDHGADVNKIDTFGKTPLNYAVKNDNKTIINILLDHGADDDFELSKILKD